MRVKEKTALVLFESEDSVSLAIESYAGPWSIAAFDPGTTPRAAQADSADSSAMNTPPEAESDMRDPGMSSAHVPGTSPVLGGGDRAGASAAGEAELSTPPAAAASSPSSRQPDGAPPPPAEAESTQEQPPPEQNGGDALPVGDSSAPITSASALFGGETPSAPDAPFFAPPSEASTGETQNAALFAGEVATTDAAALFGGLPAERTSGFPATPVSPSGAPPFGSPAAATAEPLDDVRSAVSPNSKNASTTNEAASEADALSAQGVVPSESQVSPTNVASAPPTEEAASLFPSEPVSGDLFGSTSALAPDHSAEPFTGAPDPEPAAALFGSAPQLDQAAAPFASAPAPVGSFVDSAGDQRGTPADALFGEPALSASQPAAAMGAPTAPAPAPSADVSSLFGAPASSASSFFGGAPATVAAPFSGAPTSTFPAAPFGEASHAHATPPPPAFPSAPADSFASGPPHAAHPFAAAPPMSGDASAAGFASVPPPPFQDAPAHIGTPAAQASPFPPAAGSGPFGSATPHAAAPNAPPAAPPSPSAFRSAPAALNVAAAPSVAAPFRGGFGHSQPASTDLFGGGGGASLFDAPAPERPAAAAANLFSAAPSPAAFQSPAADAFSSSAGAGTPAKPPNSGLAFPDAAPSAPAVAVSAWPAAASGPATFPSQPQFGHGQPFAAPAPHFERAQPAASAIGGQASAYAPPPGPSVGSAWASSQGSSSARIPCGRPACAIASFGAGGRVVFMFPRARLRLSASGERVAEGGPLRKGPVDLRSLHQLVPLGRLIPGVQHPSTAGPVAELPDGALQGHLQVRTQAAASETEKLLWTLLDVARQHQGKFKSAPGVKDAESPEQARKREQALAGVLTQNAAAALADGQHDRPAIPEVAPPADTLARIESLLVQGQREEALDLAVGARLWGLALVVASVISKERYCAVIRQYTDASFVAGSPIHTLSLIFSGQASSAIQHQGKPLLAASATTSGGVPQPALLTHWRTNLAAMIANRAPGCEQLMLELGDRLLQEIRDPFAAHIAYLLGGLSPDDSSQGAAPTRLRLLGWDHVSCPQPAPAARVLAIHRTEAFERVCQLPFSMSLQHDKLWYATLLAEAGCGESALGYVRSVRTMAGAHFASLATSNGRRNASARSSGSAAASLPDEGALGRLMDVIEVRASRAAGNLFPILNSTRARARARSLAGPHLREPSYGSTCACGTEEQSADEDGLGAW